jgi:hypothetical protein
MEILFFYNGFIPESIKSKSAFSRIIKDNPENLNFKVRSFDVSKQSKVCKSYAIRGVPTILILQKKRIMARMLGEINEREIKLLLEEIKKN